MATSTSPRRKPAAKTAAAKRSSAAARPADAADAAADPKPAPKPVPAKRAAKAPARPAPIAAGKATPKVTAKVAAKTSAKSGTASKKAPAAKKAPPSVAALPATEPVADTAPAPAAKKASARTSAAKPSARTAGKPAEQTPAKTATKTAGKTATKPARKTAAQPAAGPAATKPARSGNADAPAAEAMPAVSAAAPTPAADTAATKPKAKSSAKKAAARPDASKRQKPAPAKARGRTSRPEVAADAAPAPLAAATAAAPAATQAQPAGLPGASQNQALATAEPARTVPAEPATPSALVVVEADGLRRLSWQPGRSCPNTVDAAVRERADAAGHLRPDDDELLPLLLRRARDAGHAVHIDPAVWPLWAADRDARQRLQTLERAYAEGVGSADLQTLLHTTLPAFQAEGALFAVIAGRALIADERGLGKRVQAIAAATLWRRHFGLQRVLVLCTPAQRAAWQQQWQRLAGHTLAQPPQRIEGPLHQRPALWAQAAEVRILSPEALDTDDAHLARWAPELVIVDEPQQLAGWSRLQAPQALVLCGAALGGAPALLEGIVDWLDVQRQGALHAVRRIAAARAAGTELADAELEQLDAGLSRLMLQRLHSEVQDQLPPQVFSARLVPLAPAQREAHDRLQAQAGRLLDGWQRSGYLSDGDQWQLGRQLQALASACHRADPSDALSPLADASLAALQAQLDDWSATGTPAAALVAGDIDAARWREQLRFSGTLHWLAPGAAVPDEVPVVLQVGVPWRPPRAGRSEGCRQWVYLAAQDSLELGLLDTLAQRRDTPLAAGQRDDRPFLAGSARDGWLGACLAAWQAGGCAARAAIIESGLAAG